MKHLLCEPKGFDEVSVGVWGPSVLGRCGVAERSFWGRADVLVFRGSPTALLCVRAAFACAPGLWAASVVRALDSALCPASVSGFLPGV